MLDRGDDLAYRLRDGLLQDIVAISMLIEGARGALRDGAPLPDVDALLVQAQQAAEGDLRELRGMIDRLRLAA